jgi:CubicO group peptidase (beta-lactamase class C family)
MSRWWVDSDIAADPRHERLTPRLALTHRTGFPNWRYETGGKLAFKNDPGGIVGYSGEGFEYLAHYAERRTGTPFERLAEELVLGPAGMRSTAYTRRSWFDGRIAVPTDETGKPLEPSIRDHYLASDDLYTTAGDYGRFLATVATGQGLGRAGAAERERIQVSTLKAPCPGGVGCPDSAGFGLGWEVVVFGPDHILMHTGADLGEFTFAYIIPRTGEGAVILTNSAVGYKVVIPILKAIGTQSRFLAYLRAQAD